ncbi:MAG: hypothetical protein FWH44_05280, partial [Methanomassiliicoccaceae archaeon]|nr:hypothetical protein [Methanomassiliicoccaceae archaeon]
MGNVISYGTLGMGMPSLFCLKCKSLTPPGADRCRVCGAPVGEVEGKQQCLTDTAFAGRAEEGAEEKKTVLPRDKLAAPFFP